MELLHVLGLNYKILIAQLFNFAILLFVLYKFGYKPILKFLEDRKNKIKKGVEDAKAAEDRLFDIDKKEKEVLVKARKEANAILKKADEAAKNRKKDIINQAKEEIGQIINQEKAKIQVEKAKTLKELKREVAGLVTISVEKVLEEKIDNKQDKGLIEKMVKSV